MNNFVRNLVFLFIGCLFLINNSAFAQKKKNYPVSGADEATPSKSQYFSWISNTNEGSNEEQTRTFMEFFKWLHDAYGLQLDIYALDAGNIDGGKYYGSIKSERFQRFFPNNFAPLSEYAATMGTRMGLWGGPDGFGDTPIEADERIETMVSLFRDYNFALLKMDAVCGQLRKEKYNEFDTMMTLIRSYTPDMILLNHRLQLGQGEKHATTFLLGGAETYIDVHMANTTTAPHHRAEAIARELPKDLTRLTEDHGVCLSSYMDYWEDDLILQAFNRNLILAPQIYGNPWLLRDDEYSQLAFIFNLHRSYNDILVKGMPLPENIYGPNAVARGDASTRFITLRNLTWEPKKYVISLDKEIGLTKKGKAKVRLYHPYVYDLGSHAYGSTVEVEVLPFRSALVKVTTQKEKDKVTLSGIPYQIINDKRGGDVTVKLLGKAGETYAVRLESKQDKYTGLKIDSDIDNELLSGKMVNVTFSGKRISGDYHKKLAVMKETAVPQDADAIYYASCFAADNNALEVRSLNRSGDTNIPKVQKARDAFFKQQSFVGREVWDKYLFDDDLSTSFSIDLRWGDLRVNGQSAFYMDLGEETKVDKMEFRAPDLYSIVPWSLGSSENAYISSNMKNWKRISVLPGADVQAYEVDLTKEKAFRYIRFDNAPLRLAEISGFREGKKLDRSKWRANNLFGSFRKVHKAWKTSVQIDHINRGAYLCVALDGKHGEEGAWVGFKIDGAYVGAPDRAPAYLSNAWECAIRRVDKNYTYYLPLTPDMVDKKIEVYALGFNVDVAIQPSVWLTAYPIPFESKIVVLTK